MAVYGNRLAGVTSDGGFVVWELPEVITDDVPYVFSVFTNHQFFSFSQWKDPALCHPHSRTSRIAFCEVAPKRA